MSISGKNVFALGLAVVVPLSLWKLYKTILPKKPKVLQAGKEMFDGVADLYDTSSSIWESVWGEHMHSGFYPLGCDASKYTKEQHLEAQHQMMVELISLLPKNLPIESKEEEIRVLDCGCGVGGSSRFLFRHLSEMGFQKISIVGITLSSYQQNRATEITRAELGPDANVTFQVANALSTPFADNNFHFVWSLESGEHMPNKNEWVKEMSRVLKPNGHFLKASWCHREVDEDSERGPLTPYEKQLLGRISKNYSLPYFVPLTDYRKAGEANNLIGFEDYKRSWTEHVLPFWPAVISSSLQPLVLFRIILSLPFGGFTTFKGAVTAFLMMQGFKAEILNFGVIVLTKKN